MKIIYLASLALTTITIWLLLYYAQFLEYDLNYAFLIYAFLLSVLATVALTIMWFKARTFIKQNSTATIVFLICCSPLTVTTVIGYYRDLFGQLKL